MRQGGDGTSCDPLKMQTDLSTSFNNTWKADPNTASKSQFIASLRISDGKNFQASGFCNTGTECDFGSVANFFAVSPTDVIVQWENGVVAKLSLSSGALLEMNVSILSVNGEDLVASVFCDSGSLNQQVLTPIVS